MAGFAKVASYGLRGMEGYNVSVEVDMLFESKYSCIVGLPDAAVREAKERVRAAIKNSGFSTGDVGYTISLAPADLKKEGSLYDLPMAIGVLAARGDINKASLNGFVIFGELSLDGTVRGVNGVLPMLIDAKEHGANNFIIPFENAAEASYIEDINVYAVSNLRQAVAFLREKIELLPLPMREWTPKNTTTFNDFALIKGNTNAKRAAEIAAAGNHNMLMIGTPGSGKTMLARSIPSILPDLTKEEAIEVTKLHSIAGTLPRSEGLISSRPFRSPHHTSSAPSLVGGGQKAVPGEISLAHYGVLFLDEFPEFKRDVLEALRQPLEDGVVTISRAAMRATYPADFMLIAAMNPCPCGNFGSKRGQCRCSFAQVQKYQQRISGPMLDRIDLHVEMCEVEYADLASHSRAESSADIRIRVERARKMQSERYKSHFADGIRYNGQLDAGLTEKYCTLDADGEKLLESAFTRLNMSARAHKRLRRVARTIADLAGAELIGAAHIAEAIQYRSLDTKYWNN